ncbi:hybrid signal transduction histidine kinase M [Tanacetum coccineum]
MYFQDTFPDLKTVRSLLLTEEIHLKTKSLASPMDSSSPMVLMADSGNPRHSSFTPQTKPWKPCFNFAKGTCRFGDGCRFVHDATIKKSKNQRVEKNTSNIEELLATLLSHLGITNKPNIATKSPRPTIVQPSPPTAYYMFSYPGLSYYQAHYGSPSALVTLPSGFGYNVTGPSVTSMPTA